MEALPDDLIGTRQVAEMLGVSIHTVRCWINAGKLPGFRIGGRIRVSRADVVAMVQRVETAGPMLRTKAETEMRAAWVDATLRKAGIRK